MAKFTKLNIGDAVASSGGKAFKRLSAESEAVADELAGTWVFNDTVEGWGLASTTWNAVIEFTCNGDKYDKIVVSEGSRLKINSMQYGSTSVYSTSGGWVDSTYKTITVTTLAADDSSNCLEWLKANATKTA